MLKMFENGAKALLIFVGVLLTASVAMGQSAGTVSDPLISKSYVDHFLRFRSMVLPADTSMTPESGAMLVVRSGQLRLEAAPGRAVIDLTAGREISGNTDLPHNHLIMVPDNSGIVLKARKLTMLMASYINEEQKP